MSLLFRPKTASPHIVLILSSLVCACITEKIEKKSSVGESARIFSGDNVYSFSPLGSRYNIDPLMDGDGISYAAEDLSEIPDPFAKDSARTYYHEDGAITKHYYLQPGKGAQIATLLVAHVPGLTFYEEDPQKPTNGIVNINTAFNQKKHMAPNQVMVMQGAVNDARPSGQFPGIPTKGKIFGNYNHQTGAVSDLMVVYAESPEKLLEIDSFLTSLLTELPLVEVKVRVVEVAVSEIWDWGNENIISYLTSSDKAFLKEWFNFYSSESFTKAGDPNDFQGTLFNALGVHDKYELDATFELLQRVTDSDVLSAPTLAVLNGHRAIIETGDREPIPYVVSTPTAASYSYTYKQLGVLLSIVPYVLPGDIIEIHLLAEVQAVTGREAFQTSIGTLSQPVISNRSASTRLRIKEGQAFALGGLMSTSEFVVVTKLPLLGDIPILGYLFKNKRVEKAQSQIIFFIEPRVVKREYGWMKREEE